MKNYFKEEHIKYFNLDSLHLSFSNSKFDILKSNFISKINNSIIWDIYIEKITNSRNKNFLYEYFFKIDYRNQKYNLFQLRFWNDSNKLEINWRFLRLSRFKDVNFSTNDIFDFIKDNFWNISIKKLDIALDFYVKEDKFLEKLYSYLKNTKKVTNLTNYQSWYDFESINIWNLDEKDNKYYYYRIYDKKKEIIKNDNKILYLDYFNNSYDIFRFEISLRTEVAKNFKIDDFYFKNNKNKKLFDILITYFNKKWVDVFDLKYEKFLIKSIENNVSWSLDSAINKTNNVRVLKSINTSLKKIEDETWEDRINLLKKLDKTILDNTKHKEYLILYESLFETIFIYYDKSNLDEIKYQDLVKIINWWLERVSSFLWISINEFLNNVRWEVNNNISLIFSLFDEKIIKVIHLYYFNKQFKDDNIFLFLKIINESNITELNKFFDENFSKRYLSKLEKKINYLSNNKNINSVNLLSIILK